eukprot:CAMPEP_0119014658 /NCGR_PEP_ID=MMETSP1176-20130426/10129_1 /TAXON_ID=265551 /ORGANISM="Synedropsis recta cf, Strain CCMP1620" /LENGTH=232 /DNA_ID=CAMNT_0006967871 /DNA_START=84 /DNA_END=783 /DNA_ORIENTATION=+
MIIKPHHTRFNYVNQGERLLSSAEMKVEEGPIKNTQKLNNDEKKKRNVSFFDRVTVRETMHFKDYSETERASCWYRSKDFALIKKHAQPTVQQIKSGTYQGDCHQHCARGLEFRIDATGRMNRQHNKAIGWVVVLDEQDSQLCEGVRNAEAIAKSYMSATRHCMVSAYSMGLLDEAEASGSDQKQEASIFMKPMGQTSVKRAVDYPEYSEGEKCNERKPAKTNCYQVDLQPM